MLRISVFPNAFLTEEQVDVFASSITSLLSDLDLDNWEMRPHFMMIEFSTCEGIFVDLFQFNYAMKEAAKAINLDASRFSVSFYSM